MHFEPAVREFLEQPLIACLATLNPDGTPHLTYVWYELAGDRFLVSTEDRRVKARNLTRDARAGLSVLDPANPFRWVSVSGRTRLSRSEANELILKLALRYQGEPGRAFAEQMQGPRRIVISLEPEHLLASGF